MKDIALSMYVASVAKMRGASMSRLKFSAYPSVSEATDGLAGGVWKVKAIETGPRLPTELTNFHCAQSVLSTPVSYAQFE